MTNEKKHLSDLAVSRLRTLVPIAWGTVVAFLLPVLREKLPGQLGQSVIDVLGSETVLVLLVSASISGWYWVWRKLEPRIPDWLTRVVLGSAQAPRYTPEKIPDGPEKEARHLSGP